MKQEQGWTGRVRRPAVSDLRQKVAEATFNALVPHIGIGYIAQRRLDYITADAALAAVSEHLLTDRNLDAMLEQLSRRAGHPPNMTGLGLARWDLKAVLAAALSVEPVEEKPDDE